MIYAKKSYLNSYDTGKLFQTFTSKKKIPDDNLIWLLVMKDGDLIKLEIF